MRLNLYRKAKVKCIHDGTPPCQNCQRGVRTNPDDCVLSGPYEQDGVRIRDRSRRYTRTSHEDPISNTSKDRSNPNSEAEGSGLNPLLTVQLGLTETPRPILLQAAKTFSRKFPELAFLHLPTISQRINQSDLDYGIQILLTAILALCAPFLGKPSGEISFDLRRPEEYAQCIRTVLAHEVISTPCIEMVQTLLVISMYEWSGGSGYKAWMYSGMAIRMMQALEVMDGKKNISGTAAQVKNRTQWSCFVLDKMVFYSKCPPPALPLSTMKIDFPVGEQDFAFGTDTISSPTTQKHNNIESSVDKKPFTIDNYYSVLIKGIDIWSRVMVHVTTGGRRRPEMLKPESAPWLETSPWNALYRDLMSWRLSQEDHLKYNDHFVAAQVSLGRGESTAYVNLVYYIWYSPTSRFFIAY